MDEPSSAFPAGLAPAHARDRAAARALIDALGREGRAGHPAIPHLEEVLADQADAAAYLHIAAVAFEAAVRLRLGRIAGAAAAAGARPPEIAEFLVERSPTEWESGSTLPYTEVDWRRAVAAAAGDLARNRFEMPATLPGAHLFLALRDHLPDRAAFVAALLGPVPRDDTLDPVATAGNFLAQALPGYEDLDRLYRQHRERLIAGSAPPE